MRFLPKAVEQLLARMRNFKWQKFKFPNGEFDITLAEVKDAKTGISRKFRLRARLNYTLVFEEDTEDEPNMERDSRWWPPTDEYHHYQVNDLFCFPDEAQIAEAAQDMVDFVYQEESDSSDDDEKEEEDAEAEAAPETSKEAELANQAKRVKKE